MNIRLFVEICAKEIQKSSKGMGFMQIIQSSYSERSLLIEKLKEICKFINQRKTLKENKEAISNIMGDLINLRMITLKYVEAIMSFNDQIKCNYKLSEIKTVPENLNLFLLISQNFYDQISSDSHFLFNSPLSEAFQFFPSNDPFLLYNSNTNPDNFEDTTLNDSKNSRTSHSKCIFLPLPYDIKRRIVEAEFAMRPDIERQEVALRKVVKVRLKKNKNIQKNIPKFNPLNMQKAGLDNINMNFNAGKYNNNGKQSYENKKQQDKKQIIPKNNEKNSINVLTNQRNSKPFVSSKIQQNIQSTYDNIKGDNIVESPESLLKVNPNDESTSIKKHEKIQRNNHAGALKLKGLDIKESKVISILENYFSKLSHEMKSSFDNPQSLLKKAKEGRGHFWLGYGSSENLLGLAVIGIDKLSITNKKMTILNASIIDESKYEILLEDLINFIMINFSCNEIKIEVRHFKVGNELKLFPLIKEKLSKFKFKWKNISNNSSEERILILSRANPTPINDLRFFNYSIETNICTILGLHKSRIDPTNTSSSDSYIISSQIEAIRTMEKQIPEFNFVQAEDLFVSYYSNVKDYFKFSSGQKLFSTELDEINNVMKVPNVKNPSEYTGFSLSFQNICFNFESYDYTQLSVENIIYKYIRVRAQIKKSKYENNIILIFPTSERNISAFIIFNTTNSDISEVKNVLNNIPDIEPEDIEVWIPAFDKKDFSSLNTITNLETNNGFISTLKEAIHLQLIYEEPIEGCIECDLSANSIIINTTFIFGISDERIEKPLDYYVFYTKINSNHWFRV